MLAHRTRRLKTQKDDTNYMTASSAAISVYEPVIALPHSLYDPEAGKEMAVHLVPQDQVEASSYRYTHSAEGQVVISAPLDLPLPGEYLRSNPNDDSVFYHWWSGYDACQQMEDEQASALSPGLWPWTMSSYADVRYQDESNSAASIASPFVQGNYQLCDPRLDYEEETAATPWLPRDCSFSPRGDLTQSLGCLPVLARATSSKTLIQTKSICPQPILSRPGDDEDKDTFDTRNPRRRESPTHQRSTSTYCRDAFLVQSKLAGMSYKQIKENGQFVEAESTLRGRFRSLTKQKEHRVRKPEWQEGDIQLLGKAVQVVLSDTKAGRVSHQPGSRAGHLVGSSKIPWKQVAEYIWENGGSYHFGNATCRKKWDETRCLRSQERFLGAKRTGC